MFPVKMLLHLPHTLTLHRVSVWGHTLPLPHSHPRSWTLTPALGPVPIPVAFPSTDNALCPTKEALIQALGPCLALSAAPPTPLQTLEKAPGAAPPQPAEVPRGTSVWLWWRERAEVLTLRGRVCLRETEGESRPVRVSQHPSVSECMCVSLFMWAQASGSWESPSPDNKCCERKERMCCQTSPVYGPRVRAGRPPTPEPVPGSGWQEPVGEMNCWNGSVPGWCHPNCL